MGISSFIYVETLVVLIILWLGKESYNSGAQQFQPYQQNYQLLSSQFIEHRNNMT